MRNATCFVLNLLDGLEKNPFGFETGFGGFGRQEALLGIQESGTQTSGRVKQKQILANQPTLTQILNVCGLFSLALAFKGPLFLLLGILPKTSCQVGCGYRDEHL